jgi:crossover junction endodeoxyribonuclease RuvC
MQKNEEQIILAIDPGYDRCGVAIVSVTSNTGTLLHSQCITTKKTSLQETRFAEIYREIERIIKKWKPTALALETLFFSVNKKSAMKVAEARGMIVLLAGLHEIELVELSPQEVKQSMTGRGNADKTAVQKMVALTLGIDTKDKLDDEIDAIALGFAAIGTLQQKKWK